MIYKATEDGFNSKTFYSKVSNISPVLILIKTNYKVTFGGITYLPYAIPPEDGSIVNSHDARAMVFSLTN